MKISLKERKIIDKPNKIRYNESNERFMPWLLEYQKVTVVFLTFREKAVFFVYFHGKRVRKTGKTRKMDAKKQGGGTGGIIWQKRSLK